MNRSTAQLFGDPSTPRQTASDRGVAPVQPFSVPLGTYTGAPPQTAMQTDIVVAGIAATLIVSPTRENRFVVLTAPFVGFTIAIGGAGVQFARGLPLPAGLPYEISLPGNQGIYAVSNAPVALRIGIQIAAALAGDLERRMGS